METSKTVSHLQWTIQPPGQPGAACARAVHGAPSQQAWDVSDVLEASHNAFRENTKVTVLSVISRVLEFYSDSYYKTKTEKVIPMQSRWQGVSCGSVPFVSGQKGRLENTETFDFKVKRNIF